MAEAIIIITVVLGIILVFMYLSKSGGKMLKEREDKINRAEPGKAKILSFSTVGLRGSGSWGEYQANRFAIEVSSAYKSPYQTITVWNVYPMGAPKVQEGCELDVKIDIDDPNVVYPLANGVEYSWMGAMMDKGHKK